MSRNLNTTFRGQKLLVAGYAEEGSRVILTTPDTMTDGDFEVVSNLTAAGAVAITLPSNAGVGTILRVRDGKGDAAANNVTISSPAGETIEGAASVTITVNYGCLTLRKDSSTTWVVLSRSFAAAGAMGAHASSHQGGGADDLYTGNTTYVKHVNHTVSVAASTTAATAGGNLAIAAAAGNTTGAGGTASVTAGAGGNDAVGGAASLTGGAAGGGNRAGGAALQTGGAGAGSAAGGAAGMTGGVGGATGAGGAANVTGGAGGGTSGTGGAVAVAGGAGSAGNADGGAVTINGGAPNGSGARGSVTIQSAVATPAGGSVAARLLFGTTAGFGIYYGSGAPTVSAALGSIYIRSDGSSISTRLYTNTDGGTTWTNFVSGA